MKKEYIVPRVFVVEVKGCQLLYSHSISADPETTTEQQCVRRFIDETRRKTTAVCFLATQIIEN